MSHTFFGNKNLHMYVFLYLIILPFPPFWSKGSSQKLLDTLWHISTALANTDYFEAALHVSFFIPGWRDIGDPGSAQVIRMVEDSEPKMPGTLLISSASRS